MQSLVIQYSPKKSSATLWSYRETYHSFECKVGGGRIRASHRHSAAQHSTAQSLQCRGVGHYEYARLLMLMISSRSNVGNGRSEPCRWGMGWDGMKGGNFPVYAGPHQDWHEPRRGPGAMSFFGLIWRLIALWFSTDSNDHGRFIRESSRLINVT